MDNLMTTNLYELLDIVQTASTREIKTAYRKKALSCHPDKNPDNPRAGELFHELSRALEILIDDNARSAYDKVLIAKEKAKIRSANLDAKRKRFKDQLEAREESFRSSLMKSEKSPEEKLREEIERLQKEGSKLVEEEISFVHQQIHQQMRNIHSKGQHDDCTRVKIKWNSAKDDEQNGGYSYDVLWRILSKYGEISVLIVSGGKKGRGLVEFKEKSAAVTAIQVEKGFVRNPLTLQSLSDDIKQPKSNITGDSVNFSNNSASFTRIFPSADNSGDSCKINSFPSFSTAPDIFGGKSAVSDGEFETMVLGNLRRAEERKKLIEKLKEDDDNS